ncbi:protein OCTOPUS-like [Abrus precatorius]|uniref:Protein OCTOPUS-like n=1 Tax=Abrus precatorius TaxID=3816 RepID=A0A8B8LAF9_ABRPR|nr:protein OCTOPUS-like [Abrus precatorius]
MNPTTQPPPQPPPLLPPQPPPLQQPLQPHRPSTSCDRHPQEQFTGFCPSCLCERLAVLDPNSSSSTRKPPTSSTAAAALKAIFRPSTAARAANRPPLSSSSSFFPELRRTKSFSASKNEGFSGAFEPQRRSCDVRARSTLFSLFNQDDERKIPKKETEVETRNLASSSVVQGPVIETKEEEEDIIVVEDDEDEVRVLEEPEPEPKPQLEQSNVIEDRVHEIVEEEPEIEAEAEAEVYVEAEEVLKPMKEHMDLDSQAKKSSGRDFKEIAGSFWSAASVFSKKLQKWRQKQKMKKRGRNGAVVGSRTLLPVEKPIGRQFRETQSEIADYGFGRRSCDTDPRFSLDAGRMSFDGDPRYSFDEPRASWDGYLMARSTFPLPPRMPTMLSVVEDAPVQVLRTDTLIPVEEPLTMAMNAINEHEDETLPGGSAQTREYYSDSSARRRKSLDRSSSIRKTAAAVVAEMDELKPVTNANAKVTPAASADYFHPLRDSNSNSLRDDSSEMIDVRFRDGNNGGKCNGDRKGGSKKSSSRWSKVIWGFIHRRGGGGGNKDEDEDSRYSRGNGNGNGVERSYSESWQEFRGERNPDGRGGFNPKVLRSNSCVSWRNAQAFGGFGGMRKSDVQANGHHGRKGRDEFVLERNRSARYSPNNGDNNGLLRLYLTPARGGWRNGSGKGSRSNQAHSIARSVLRLY